MRPLIKWPGGKAREYKNIKDIIPSDIETYIEPFFGGGGIYFNLEPKNSIINDINENLMSLYTLLKKEDGDFKEFLKKIANDWDNLSIIASAVFNDIKKYKNNISKIKIEKEISKLSKDTSLPGLINGQEKYWDLLCMGLIDKLNRIIGLEIKSGKFNDKDFYNQIVAVTKGAYYYYLRDKFKPKNRAEETAQFFFIREYCFGSMFRFNAAGKFNIPYGGASYNEKGFHSKVDYAFSPPVINMLKGTKIYCLDFKDFVKKIEKQINKRDFCFFDPPYDTEFSEYDKHSFVKKDQEDLAKIFARLKCRGLMIIKKTPFILEVYQKLRKKNKNITINEYGKNYSYNVRGRNKREVTHLLILNYKPKAHNVTRSNEQQSFSRYL